MGEGRQSAAWRVRYNNLWAARADITRQLIARGESEPMRIIHTLERMEQHMELVADGRSASWRVRQIDPKTALPSGVPAMREAAFNGGALQMSAYTYASLSNFLADFVTESGPFDAVIELGCGFGQNLFRLYYAGLPKQLRYFGGELAGSGVALGRTLAALRPEIPVEFFPFDHLAPDLSMLPKLSRPLVFTCHSLEQVEEVPQSFFAAVARCAERVTCIHLEPFGFQVRPIGPIAQAHRKFFEGLGWNMNLYAAATQAEQGGVIKRTVVIPDIFLSSDAVNATSLMVWTTAGAGAKAA